MDSVLIQANVVQKRRMHIVLRTLDHPSSVSAKKVPHGSRDHAYQVNILGSLLLRVYSIFCFVVDRTHCSLTVITRYSRTLLSQISLSRITAYLEVKIWSLIKHKNLTTGNKMLWKRGDFSAFPRYFQYVHIFKSQIKYSFVKCGCSIYIGLSSTNLLCRATDISKYFRESLGLRDNGSRLYIP